MASKLSRTERNNRVEHYAYRTSQKCVKYEDIKVLVGGWHCWHPVILPKLAKKIYLQFVETSNELEQNKTKIETLKAVDKHDEDTMMYRIHIYNQNRTEKKRKAMWTYAGIYLKLRNDLGYTRIFKMPCKCLF